MPVNSSRQIAIVLPLGIFAPNPAIIKAQFPYDVPSCDRCDLRQRSVFSRLDNAGLKSIAFGKECSLYRKGQLVFHEGNRPAGLYCIFSGKVKIFKIGESGKEQIVRLASQADILGYRSMICDEAYTASAETLEDTSVCFIPRAVFLKTVESNPAFAMSILRLLSKDLKEAEKKIAVLAQKHVKERIAGAILLLKEKYGLETDNATLTVSLTREDLSNLVGTATESLIRLLQELQSEKIIALKKRKIVILDQQALVRAAGICD